MLKIADVSRRVKDVIKISTVFSNKDLKHSNKVSIRNRTFFKMYFGYFNDCASGK